MSRQIRTPGARAEPAPQPAEMPADDDRPNLADIDVDTLMGPVLTRQGWLCPPDRTREELARLRERLATRG